MEFEYYRTIEGDTWDSISYKVYGSEEYFKDIYEANKNYSNIAIFNGGIELKVPVIKVVEISTLPPWKRG